MKAKQDEKKLELKNGVWRASYDGLQQSPHDVTFVFANSECPALNLYWTGAPADKNKTIALVASQENSSVANEWSEHLCYSIKQNKIFGESFDDFSRHRSVMTGHTHKSERDPEQAVFIRENLHSLAAAFRNQLPFTEQRLNINELYNIGITIGDDHVFAGDNSEDHRHNNIHPSVENEYSTVCDTMRKFVLHNALAHINQRAEEILPTLDKIVEAILGR